MAIGAIWGEIWNEAIWNTAIWSQSAPADSTPDAFSFVDRYDVAVNTVITSAAITVSGIDTAAAISISGGEYEINNSASWASTPGTVNNGDTVKVRHTSSASYLTSVNTTLTIGGVSDVFSSTTILDPASTDENIKQSVFCRIAKKMAFLATSIRRYL